MASREGIYGQRPCWRRCAWVILCSGLIACAGPVSKDSPFYPVPVGSKLILYRDLEVPAASTRVYLQHGEMVKQPTIFSPFCRFEVRDVLPVAQVIRADQFTVRKTQLDMLHVSMASPVLMAGDSGSGPSDMTLVWYLWLDSSQPGVRRLTCGGKFDSLNPRAAA